MANSHWRETSAEIIARVLQDTADCDEKTIRKALHDAYPFGERAMHPYKIWTSEVRRQRGLPKPKSKQRKAVESAGQGSLLGEFPEVAK